MDGRRQGGIPDCCRPEFSVGAPAEAFNVHNQAFQRYIVDLIVEAATKYEADGINLDYIRSIGDCMSVECEVDYRQKYGRSLGEDLQREKSGGRVRTLAEWNAAALSTIVFGVSQRLREIKPKMVISIDTIPFDESRVRQGVDLMNWIIKGAIDSVVYMAYENPIDISRVSDAARKIGPRANGRADEKLRHDRRARDQLFRRGGGG